MNTSSFSISKAWIWEIRNTSSRSEKKENVLFFRVGLRFPPPFLRLFHFLRSQSLAPLRQEPMHRQGAERRPDLQLDLHLPHQQWHFQQDWRTGEGKRKEKRRDLNNLSTLLLHLYCSVCCCLFCCYTFRTHLIVSESDPDIAGSGSGSVTRPAPSVRMGRISVRDRINTGSSEVEDSHTDLVRSSGPASGITCTSYRINTQRRYCINTNTYNKCMNEFLFF